MSVSSISSIAAHKAYRLQEAIKQLEHEVKINPSKQSALMNLRESLAYWRTYAQKNQ